MVLLVHSLSVDNTLKLSDLSDYQFGLETRVLYVYTVYLCVTLLVLC